MALASEGFSTFHFSTEHVPPERRIPLWHELFGRSVSRRLVVPVSEQPFNMDMTVHRIGRADIGLDAAMGVSVMRMTLTSGGAAYRTKELLSDGNDDVILHVHESGRRIISQLGREAAAETGGGVLSSNGDRSTILLPEHARFASIALPRKTMKALAPGLEDAFVRPLPPDVGVLRLLMSYLDVLEDEAAMHAPELQRAVATHIHDLCALAIGATQDAAEIARSRGLRAARLRAIKSDIARNLADGDVSAAALARRHRVTARYIHKLFETEGATLSRYVLGQRLVRAYRMLGDARHAHLTVGAIAYKAGFGDLSTFNREFRRHYGMTPSEVRAAAI